ncbi:helix-turn-helix domain-containing protein [Arthrobacter crystallopoietes]|uniref:helix-turn-helix domain-containing protein n=1 Tax=Crystallibacter crystallopoietes TaxID=37928 RepID=UPI003D20DB73
MAENDDGNAVFLSVAQVAARLNVSKMTIYRMVHTGEMPAVLIGHTYRVRETALALYLEHGLIAAKAACPVITGSGPFRGGLRGKDTV